MSSPYIHLSRARVTDTTLLSHRLHVDEIVGPDVDTSLE